MEEQRNANEYRTGGTRPKENRTGPIAALLIGVIFLGGLVSAFGLLNAHLTKKETPPISFSKGETTDTATEETAGEPHAPLGFSCQPMAMTYQYLHQLPSGLYINRVEPGSPAYTLGIAPGDVLVSFDGTPVTNLNTLNELLSLCPKGKEVVLVIYHTGLQSSVMLTLNWGE